jgi:hypothetical protein
MTVLTRRLLNIALAGLAGATAIGLLAPNATVLVIGILVLGVGMIAAILFYLLRPVPGVLAIELSDWPLPLPLPVAPPTAREPVTVTRNEAEIVPLADWRERKGTLGDM